MIYFYIGSVLTLGLVVVSGYFAYKKESDTRQKWAVCLLPIALGFVSFFTGYRAEKESNRLSDTSDVRDSTYKSNFSKTLDSAHVIIDSLKSASTKALITFKTIDSVNDKQSLVQHKLDMEMKTTSNILTMAKSTLKQANANIIELVETRKALGAGESKPIISVQCLPLDSGKANVIFLCANSSDKYPINDVSVNGIDISSDFMARAHVFMSREESVKLQNDIESTRFIKTLGNIPPDSGERIYEASAKPDQNLISVLINVRWNRGGYGIDFRLRRQGKTSNFLIESAIINGKPAPKSMYYEAGVDKVFNRY